MDLFTGFLVYFLIWWVVIFCVLPLGVRRDSESGVGAPVDPQLKKKFLITTGISVLLWLLVYALVAADIIDFRAISMEMIKEDSL